MNAPGTPPTVAPPSPALSDASFVSASLSLVVPSFVRRRVPRFPTFSRLKSEPIPATSHTRSWSSDMAGSGTVTPPPSYSETLAPLLTPLKFARRSLPQRAEEKVAVAMVASSITSAPRSDGLCTAATNVSEEKRDIQWKFANQGLSLLSLSSQESTSITGTSATSETSLARHLYIDGLTYLLRALPTNLTEAEATSLSAAIPPSLIPEPLDIDSSDSAPSEDSYFPATDPAYNFDPSPTPVTEQTLLHRAFSYMIIKFCLLVAFLLPHLQTLFATLLRVNREHHITERIFRSTVNTADVVSRSTWAASAALLSLQDGRVGRAAEGIVSWWVRGVSGGVWEGVGEGMAVLGLTQQQQQREYSHSHSQAQYGQERSRGQQQCHTGMHGHAGSHPSARGYGSQTSGGHASGYEHEQGWSPERVHQQQQQQPRRERTLRQQLSDGSLRGRSVRQGQRRAPIPGRCAQKGRVSM